LEVNVFPIGRDRTDGLGVSLPPSEGAQALGAVREKFRSAAFISLDMTASEQMTL